MIVLMSVVIDRDGISACCDISVSVVVKAVSVSDGFYNAIIAMVLGSCLFSKSSFPGFLVILPITQYSIQKVLIY